MIKMTEKDVLVLYRILTDKTGGTVGIRDKGMMLSALEAPYQTFAGYELFPSLIKKAARLGYGLVANGVDLSKKLCIHPQHAARIRHQQHLALRRRGIVRALYRSHRR